jgi:hypothetical protein
MKNNINILVLFGLVLMCFGLCCLAVFIQDLLEASQYNAVFRWRAPQVFFLGTGAMSLMAGLGLMLRQRWAVRSSTLLLILVAGAWTFFLLSEFQRSGEEVMVRIGMTVFVYSALLFGILFLNNEYVLRLFDEAHSPEGKNEDILDW